MLHTFTSLFDIYPDTISDGEIVIGFKKNRNSKKLSFPFALEIGDTSPDDKNRYRASDIGLLPVIVRNRRLLNKSEASQAWFGNNVCGSLRAQTGNETLKEVRFVDGVTTIGEYALRCCYTVESVFMPDDVVSIEQGAFSYCWMRSITIPDSVITIGDSAFEHCHFLTSVMIPDGVKEIHSDAFAHSYSLTSITIPGSVKRIGWRAFNDCFALRNIFIDQTESDSLLLASAFIPEDCTIHWNTPAPQTS